MKKQNSLVQLEKKFKQEKKRILPVGIAWQGSLNKRWMTCGNPNCRCKKDSNKKHGPYWWWTKKVEGKTKAVFIPLDLLPEVKRYIHNYKILKQRFNRLLQLSDEYIQKKLQSSKNSISKKH